MPAAGARPASKACGVCAIIPENWTLTAGWRSKFSRCLQFDPTNPLSARFNPLLEVRKGAHEGNEANLI
jgi:type IV secretory pathway TraG/TraD family ATPase VirD4